jgi:hypothetical protein
MRQNSRIVGALAANRLPSQVLLATPPNRTYIERERYQEAERSVVGRTTENLLPMHNIGTGRRKLKSVREVGQVNGDQGTAARGLWSAGRVRIHHYTIALTFDLTLHIAGASGPAT